MKLGLGTAQLGLDYGVSNQRGRPGADAVREILAYANTCGIQVLDTAPAYGDSEIRIGSLRPPAAEFRVVTKTPLHDPDDSGPRCAERIARSVRTSLDRLQVTRLAGVLEHRPHELLSSRGEAIFSSLERLRAEGLIEKLGVSSSGPDLLRVLAERLPIDLVQLPLNALDRRAVEDGTLSWLRGRGIEVHVRSVFLQGALLMPPDSLPQGLEGLRGPVDAFQRAAQRQGLSPLQAAVAAVAEVADVDVMLCGVQSCAELVKIVAAAGAVADGLGDPVSPLVTPPVVPRVAARWLDPARWAVGP